MAIEIKGLDNLQKSLGKLSSQMDYALTLTVNDLAFDIHKQMKLEINDSLDVKIKRLSSAFRIKKASKKNIEAKVYVPKHDWRYNVLVHHTAGGVRTLKGLEKLLRGAGFLYGNEIMTPSPGVRIKPGTYTKMISDLRIQNKEGFSSHRAKKSRGRLKNSKYFIAQRGVRRTQHLHEGIYVRQKGVDLGRPIAILRKAKAPNYEKDSLMSAYEVGGFILKKHGQDYFYKNMIKALRTAR